jgi:diguanylate cyclase (GGDEF)-like protein/PAS domain S-box-containing protein
LIAGHAVFVLLGEYLIRTPDAALRVWPSAALVTFGLWRLTGARVSWTLLAVAVTGWAARLWVDTPAVAFEAQALDLLEVGVGLLLLDHFGGRRTDESVPALLRDLGLVGAVASAICMPLHAMDLDPATAGGWGAWGIGYWIGALTGAAFVLPLVAGISMQSLRALLERRAAIENGLVALLVAAVVWFSVAVLHQATMLVIVPVLIAAVRRGRLAAALAGVGEVIAILISGRLGHIAASPSSSVLGIVLAPWTGFVVMLPYCIARLIEDLREERTKISTSEAYFRDAMNHSPFGMALLDLEGRCVSVNRALCDFLGYEPHELIGLQPQQITHPDDHDNVLPRIGKLIAGEYDEYALEKQFLHKDGSGRWTFIAVSVVRDEKTRAPLYLIAQMQDIGARRRTEKALEESESRWNFALESAGQGVWDHDYGAGRTFYSATWSRMLGYEPGELASDADAWLDLVHPYDLSHLLHQEHLHLEGLTEQFECEFRMRHKDGRWIWILDRGKVIARGEDGRPLRMIGTHTDITEHRQLTDALLQEKERLRITLQSIGDGVICTDAAGAVTFVNPSAEALTGWSATAALGRPCDLVFRLVDEATDQPVDSIVEGCITRLHRVAREEGLLLVGRGGTRVDVKVSASPVRKPNGDLLGAVLVFQDVTRARTLQRELAQLAAHDALTGLLNRTSFERRLGELCNSLDTDRRHTLLFLDLDRFKIINDTAGHAAGDVLLREIGRVIREQMRQHDVVARLGGDEFGVLLVDCPIDAAEKIAERLLERIGRTRFSWDGRVYEVGASIGLARIDGETPLGADVMSRADVACYAAKASGRNRVSVYHASEGDARRHHHELYTAAGIRAALDAGRFVVHAQTITDLRPSGRLNRHAELLVRMIDENGDIQLPGAFIPAAERYGLMAAIDRWVIHQVLAHYDRAILAVPRLSVSINLSANSLDDPGLTDFLATELDRSALPPHRIHFEITETSLINNLTHAGRLVEDLRAAGYAIMLDDFGTGLSSFAYLEQFPIDYLKIDGGFVRKLTGNFVDRAIVESINDIGHKLGATTIAEFVEDAETLDALREIGIDMAQGYHIARPEPLDDLLARIVAEDAAELPARRLLG